MSSTQNPAATPSQKPLPFFVFVQNAVPVQGKKKKPAREPRTKHVASNYCCHYYYITDTFRQPCAFQSVTFRVHIVPRYLLSVLIMG